MIDNTNFLNFISNEQSEVKSIFLDANINDTLRHKLLEYSFIRCVVNFQQFVSNCFAGYAAGEQSIQGYIPNRKLTFENAEHLRNFFMTLKKDYIDTFENGIKSYSKYIFKDDPFALIYQDSILWQDYNFARIIRNYLMHQSGAAEREYREVFNKPIGIINPYVDLLAISGTSSLYTRLTNSLANISKILVNPTPYFT